MDKIREVIEEWKKMEKRFSLNCLGKLYPLSDADSAMLDGPPIVDASVVRLAKNVTLPMKDSASFKDPLDRRMYLNLKKAYQMAGNACKPAIALTSVSNALRVWTDNIETTVWQDIPKEDIIKALDEFKLLANFIREAAINSVRCSTQLWPNGPYG